MSTSTPVMYLLISMHACWKKHHFYQFWFLKFSRFAEKNWSEIPEFTKGGNPYKLGQTPLPQQLVIAYKVGVHLPPLTPPFKTEKLNRKTNFSQVCCWWAKFWSKWMFRQENILSGSTLDLLLEHFSGFLSYIFLRWTLCIQKPLFHWKINCSSQPSICHWLSSSIFPCSFVRWHQTKSPFCFNIYRHKSPSLTQYH